MMQILTRLTDLSQDKTELQFLLFRFLLTSVFAIDNKNDASAQAHHCRNPQNVTARDLVEIQTPCGIPVYNGAQ